MGVALLNKGSQVKSLRGTATVSVESSSNTIENTFLEKVKIDVDARARRLAHV